MAKSGGKTRLLEFWDEVVPASKGMSEGPALQYFYMTHRGGRKQKMKNGKWKGKRKNRIKKFKTKKIKIKNNNHTCNNNNRGNHFNS